MPSLVSSSSLVAKLPSVTTTAGSMKLELRLEVRAAASRSRAAAGRGCPAAGTSRRWRCTPRRGSSPMPSMRRVSSWPARPTNGTPWVLLLARALADEQQVGVGVADAEHHLGAGLGERALACRPSASLTQRVEDDRGGDGGLQTERRSQSDRASASPHQFARDRRPHRLGRHLGRHDPQAVEVRVDRAGGDREREVAVVAGVRRVDRPGQAVVRALGEQVALDFVHRALVATTHQRRVLAVLERRAAPGSRARSGGAVDPASTAPSSPTTSPTAFTTASAPTTTSPSRRARRCRARPAPRARRPATCRRVAPRPAPTRPVASVGRRLAPRRSAAAPSRARALAVATRRGRRSPPRARSAPGRRASGSRGPARRARCITPSAAASPNAEPPLKHDRVDVLDGARRLEQRESRGSPARRRGPRPSRPCPAGAPPRSRRCRRRSSARRARRGRR